jgi:beta-galactosidase
MDRIETRFGIRTVGFDANKGFLLNGVPYVIKGTCNHQDHAGVGTAMPDALQYFRIKKLKEMGSNAIRTSHNPPTPELLDACDELGMLVMDENRRVDETPVVLDDLKQLVLRDRNHPSVFIWSLGNEEGQLQGANAAASAAAKRLVKPMQDLVHQLDPTRLCTMAMNGGWGGGLTETIDVQGFNYRTRNIDKFRADFPTKLAIGTETASTRTTRGVYVDDKVRGYVAAYGENGVEKAWTWWPYYATHPFTSGGFVWTGFDYRGEPTPYKWPCISSHFGLMDTCGFPKDIYYYYKAWWTAKPMVHLAAYWGAPGSEGKTNLVRCFSNCKTVELFLNGKSLGMKTMIPNEYLDWNVRYAPGELVAKGYNGPWVAAETKVETSGSPTALELHADRASIAADGRDLSVIDVSVNDIHRGVVNFANNLIQFHLTGPGKIIGVGNGDPSSHEADKARERRTFKGYAQVLVQATHENGTIELTATSTGLRSAKIKIKTTQPNSPETALP